MTYCHGWARECHEFANNFLLLIKIIYIHGFTVKLTKPWTPEIFMECYCVARNKPIRREITKPQTATVISLWFWGLLACPELYCDWPVHNQHSWNFSGVHSFLSLTVTKWLKIIIGLVIALAAVVACYDLTSLLGEQGNLSIYFKQNCQTPWTSQAQNWKRVKDKEWREVMSRLKKKWIKKWERRNFSCRSPTRQFPLIFFNLVLLSMPLPPF